MNAGFSRQTLEALVEKHGLSLLGVVSLNVGDDYERFRSWVAQNKHAGMSFLERHHGLRADPTGLLPAAKQAIILGQHYQQNESMREFRSKKVPWLAQYARFRDYHKLLRRSSDAIMHDVRAMTANSFEYRVCVDSAPLLERALAAKSAQGFIGKNSLFIHPRLGSFLLLAEILIDQVLLPTDQRPADFNPAVRSDVHGGCGTCKRCQVNCPTGALSVDYVVDARLCISYWTIEHRGLIPIQMWTHLKDYVFGCDICQLVCPYNRTSGPEVATTKEVPVVLGREQDLAFLVGMDEASYIQAFAGTPLVRAKRDGLRRNALIAMAVTRHPGLGSALEALANDPSDVIRGTCEQIRAAGYLS